MAGSMTSDATQEQWFGHPRGLSTLFFTEMWERFSYYGMRGLLVLFLTNAIATGGFGMNDQTAAAIYGLYTASVYLLALPGGWIADRLIGQRKAVLYGGILIAAGHFSMALGFVASFYAGLVLIVLGTGLLKPNVSAIVGDLYQGKDANRDGGFSIFYMGINLGAFFGPLVCGFLGENIDWHYGFGAAGVGMVFGLIQYVMGWEVSRRRGLDDPAVGRYKASGVADLRLRPRIGRLLDARDWRAPALRDHEHHPHRGCEEHRRADRRDRRLLLRLHARARRVDP